jgi:hypothetical protein
MKAKKDIRKPVKNTSYDSDELKRARKLKPIPKEKNVKRSIFEELDEFEELEDEFKGKPFDDDEYLDDEDDEEDF